MASVTKNSAKYFVPSKKGFQIDSSFGPQREEKRKINANRTESWAGLGAAAQIRMTCEKFLQTTLNSPESDHPTQALRSSSARGGSARGRLRRTS